MNNVLIVDDDPILLKLIEAHFNKFGNIFQSLTAANDSEAKAVLSSQDVALLVTDLAMPLVENGLGLLEHVQQSFAELPCIVITAVEDAELLARLRDEVDFLFTKPVELEDLVSAITTTLEKKFFKGMMSGVPISTFLQMLRMEKKTCLLQVKSKEDEKGVLSLQGGELYNASFGELEGEEAALEMMTMKNVVLHFQYLPKRKQERVIKADLMALIIEASRRADEKAEADKQARLARAESG